MEIIISIHPKWAKLIYEGKKTIEWRKNFPRDVKIDKVLLYETTPVKSITGFFTLQEKPFFYVSSVCAQPDQIIASGCVPMVDLIKYRKNVDGIWGWMIDNVTKFDKPVPLSYLNLKRPPQNWQYLMEGK